MLNSRTVRLLIYSIGIVLLMSLKLVITENLGMSKLVTVDFEIYGRVQGVCFRKYTQREGKKLGLIGWCMNTDRGTVIGQLQGEKTKVHEITPKVTTRWQKKFQEVTELTSSGDLGVRRKLWLQHKGSPSSSIEKAEFRNEKEIAEYTMTGFSIKK